MGSYRWEKVWERVSRVYARACLSPPHMPSLALVTSSKSPLLALLLLSDRRFSYPQFLVPGTQVLWTPTCLTLKMTYTLHK